MLPFHRRRHDRSLPQNFSVRPTQAEKHPCLLLWNCADCEDAIVPDNRRSVANAGQLRLPCHVAGGTPVPGETRFETRSVSAWSPPARPVFGAQGECRNCEANNDSKSNEAAHKN